MPSDIPATQNEPQQLKLIYAYHQAYANVNRLGFIRLAMVTAAAVILPIIGAYFSAFRAYGAAITLLVFLLDLFYFDRTIDEGRKFGARIQDLFDRTVFKKKWPDHIAGEKPTEEDIQSLAKTFENSNNPERLGKLRDWYPTEVGQLPHPLAVLVCQRSNCVWDTKLRKRFKTVLLAGLLILLGLVWMLAIVLNLSISEFLVAFLVPSIPAVAFTWKLTLQQQTAIDASERTRRSLEQIREQLESTGLTEDLIDTHTDYLQAELFYRRSSVSRVPSLIYNNDREMREHEMKQAVQTMIQNGNLLQSPSSQPLKQTPLIENYQKPETSQ
jgi:hypothetical protein